MVMITGVGALRVNASAARWKNLLSMPTRPVEVLVGKIVPYIPWLREAD